MLRQDEIHLEGGSPIWEERYRTNREKSSRPNSETAVGEPWSPIRTYEIMQWQNYNNYKDNRPDPNLITGPITSHIQTISMLLALKNSGISDGTLTFH